VMAAILAIQALVFQDGGVLALGANVFNMALLGVVAGYLPFHLWGSGPRRKAAIFLGAALSVLVAGLLALSELLLSRVPMPGAAVYVSLVLFVVSALLEGVITLAVIQALETLNPGWLRKPSSEGRSAMGVLALAAIVLATGGFLVASTNPDGLERLVERSGIASRMKAFWVAPLADYNARFLSNSWLRKAAAGMAGLALIYGVCTIIGRFASRRRSA
jgi:cobalt/nickel transport system permease protein